MDVVNKVYPDEQQMAALAQAGPDQPIHMVNLLKFREKAAYDDGRETDLSGREAYGLYAAGVSELITEFGGHVEFFGHVTGLTLGEVEELWDQVAIAVYPSRAAMLGMISSDKMQEISAHRSAGLSGQLNIETVVPGETAVAT